jgi:TP901 family phage tail tape measure protein
MPANVNVNVNLIPNTKQVDVAFDSISKRASSVKFGQPLGRISGDVTEFRKSLEAATARVTAFGLTAGAIYKVSEAIRAGARATVEIDKQLVELNTFLGQSRDQLEGFSQSLFKVARNAAVPFEAASEAAKEFARQGLSANEVLRRTEDALTLARISGISYADAVNGVTTAINSFNKEALTSTDIVNKLIAVDTRFAVSSAQLNEALSRVGSSAEESGISIDKLIATVTAAQQITGRGGAVIGNALKTIFTRLQRPEVLSQLEQLGVAIKDQNGFLLDGLSVLKNYADATKNLSQIEKSRTAELIGGIYQINQVNALIKDLSSSNSVYASALKISSAATDEAKKKNEELNKSLSALLQQTKNQAQEAAAALGKPLLEPLVRIGSSFSEILLKAVNPTSDLLGKSEESGKSVGESFFKGAASALGKTIATGSIPLLVGIGGTLLAKMVKFGVSSIKDVSKNFDEVFAGEKSLASQKAVNDVLSQSPKLVALVQKGTISLAAAEQAVLQTLKEQNRQLKTQEALRARIIPTVVARGGPSRVRASGYLPAFGAAQEEVAMAKSYGAKNPKAKLIQATIKGKTQPVMVNSEEDIIPNFAGTGDTAIIPRYRKTQDIPRMSSGYVPNFSQEISSAGTSLNQIPGLFKKFGPKLGPRNIDIGGGKYDTGTNFLNQKFGIASRVYDPFNRTKEFNDETLKQFFGTADTATIANVLNVIKEGPAREDLLKFISKSIKPKGSAYFGIYEGNKSGIGAVTSKGYQRNLPADKYLEEISKYFDIKKKTGNYIIGSPLASGYIPNFNKSSEYVIYDTLDQIVFPNEYKSRKTATQSAESRNKKFGKYRYAVLTKDQVRKQYDARIANNPNSFTLRPEDILKGRASGYVPNFSSISGSFGSVSKINESQIRKTFFSGAGQSGAGEIANEFLASRKLSEQIQASRELGYQGMRGGYISDLFQAPNTYGTLQEAVKSGSIVKDFVPGKTAAEVSKELDTYTGEFQNFRDLVQGFGRLAAKQINSGKVLEARDLANTGNLMLNDKAEAILTKIIGRRNPERFIRRLGSSWKNTSRMADWMAKKGARISLIDPGVFGGLDKSRKKQLSGLGYEDNYRGFTGINAAGYIPNFAKSKFVQNIVDSYKASLTEKDPIRFAQAEKGESYYPVVNSELKNLSSMSGHSLEKLAYSLAALSGNTADLDARRGLERILNNQPYDDLAVLPANVKKVKKMLSSSGSSDELVSILGKGAKTQNFAQSLLLSEKFSGFGKYKNPLGTPSVMDSWAIYVRNGGALKDKYSRKAVSKKQKSKLFSQSAAGYKYYNTLVKEYGEAAKILGVPVRELQARTWGWARGQMESPTRNKFASGYIPNFAKVNPEKLIIGGEGPNLILTSAYDSLKANLDPSSQISGGIGYGLKFPNRSYASTARSAGVDAMQVLHDYAKKQGGRAYYAPHVPSSAINKYGTAKGGMNKRNIFFLQQLVSKNKKDFPPSFVQSVLSINPSSASLLGTGALYDQAVKYLTKKGLSAIAIGKKFREGAAGLHDPMVEKYSGENKYSVSSVVSRVSDVGGSVEAPTSYHPLYPRSTYADSQISLSKGIDLPTEFERLTGVKVSANKSDPSNTRYQPLASFFPFGMRFEKGDEISKLIGFASGRIPNFAGLSDAIGREETMSGLPASQIMAHFDKSGNPIAVTNKRDEPNGLKDVVPNFAKIPTALISRFFGKSGGKLANPISGALELFEKQAYASIIDELAEREVIPSAVSKFISQALPASAGVKNIGTAILSKNASTGSRVAAGLTGLAQIYGGVKLGELSGGDLDQRIQSRKFEDALDRSKKAFTDLAENTTELSASLSKLDAAYKDPKADPKEIVKLVKTREDLIKKITIKNPELVSRLAGQTSISDQITVLEENLKKAQTQEAIRTSALSFGRKGKITGEQAPAELSSFFNEIINRANTDIFKTDLSQATTANFGEILKKAGLDVKEFSDQLNSDQLKKAFIEALKVAQGIEKISANQAKEIARISKPLASRRQAVEDARDIRTEIKKALEQQLPELAELAGTFSRRAGISASSEATLAIKKADSAVSFQNSLLTQLNDKEFLANLSPAVEARLRNIEAPGAGAARELESLQKLPGLSEAQAKGIQKLIDFNSQQTRDIGKATIIADESKKIQLKFLALQEKIAFGGDIRTSINPQMRAEAMASSLRGPLTYQLGSMIGSRRGQVAGATDFLTDTLQKYPGLLTTKGGKEPSDIQAVKAELTRLNASDMQKDLFRRAGMAQMMGLGQTAGLLRGKAFDQSYLLESAGLKTNALFGSPEIPKDIQKAMGDLEKFNVESVRQAKAEDATLRGLENIISPIKEKLIEVSESQSKALITAFENGLKSTFGTTGIKTTLVNVTADVAKFSESGKAAEAAPAGVPSSANGLTKYSNSIADAVKREKTALASRGIMGVPNFAMADINLERSPDLVNASNPAGFAITNSIDEKNGLRSLGMRSSGFVPNFAKSSNIDPLLERIYGPKAGATKTPKAVKTPPASIQGVSASTMPFYPEGAMERTYPRGPRLSISNVNPYGRVLTKAERAAAGELIPGASRNPFTGQFMSKKDIDLVQTIKAGKEAKAATLAQRKALIEIERATRPAGPNPIFAQTAREASLAQIGAAKYAERQALLSRLASPIFDTALDPEKKMSAQDLQNRLKITTERPVFANSINARRQREAAAAKAEGLKQAEINRRQNLANKYFQSTADKRAEMKAFSEARQARLGGAAQSGGASLENYLARKDQLAAYEEGLRRGEGRPSFRSDYEQMLKKAKARGLTEEQIAKNISRQKPSLQIFQGEARPTALGAGLGEAFKSKSLDPKTYAAYKKAIQSGNLEKAAKIASGQTGSAATAKTSGLLGSIAKSMPTSGIAGRAVRAGAFGLKGLGIAGAAGFGITQGLEAYVAAKEGEYKKATLAGLSSAASFASLVKGAGKVAGPAGVALAGLTDLDLKTLTLASDWKDILGRKGEGESIGLADIAGTGLAAVTALPALVGLLGYRTGNILENKLGLGTKLGDLAAGSMTARASYEAGIRPKGGMTVNEAVKANQLVAKKSELVGQINKLNQISGNPLISRDFQISASRRGQEAAAEKEVEDLKKKLDEESIAAKAAMAGRVSGKVKEEMARLDKESEARDEGQRSKLRKTFLESFEKNAEANGFLTTSDRVNYLLSQEGKNGLGSFKPTDFKDADFARSFNAYKIAREAQAAREANQVIPASTIEFRNRPIPSFPQDVLEEATRTGRSAERVISDREENAAKRGAVSQGMTIPEINSQLSRDYTAATGLQDFPKDVLEEAAKRRVTAEQVMQERANGIVPNFAAMSNSMMASGDVYSRMRMSAPRMSFPSAAQGSVPNFAIGEFSDAITEAMRNGITSAFPNGASSSSVSNSNVINIDGRTSIQNAPDEAMQGIIGILFDKIPELKKLGPAALNFKR